MSIELLVLRMAVEEWQMVLAIFKIGLSKLSGRYLIYHRKTVI